MEYDIATLVVNILIGIGLGIEMIWKDIKSLKHNPLQYLDEAKKKGVALLSHF